MDSPLDSMGLRALSRISFSFPFHQILSVG